MRLINTTTLEQREFFDSQVPKYAILSHCWSGDEISLAQYQAAPNHTDPAFSKINRCCEIARSQGLEWAWIDTCCIDKSSSAELSEAINSMYNWYRRAEVCYVFLDNYDGAIIEDPQDCDSVEAKSNSGLSQCRWFTRGWTLQELVASRNVLFYDMNDFQFGTKSSLVKQLSSIARIGISYMNGEKSPHQASVACRMSWASHRITTRSEDIAYCLLGLFDVNMPLLYGEGELKAFGRLQGAIISQFDDESIFSWTSAHDEVPRGLLADHPNEFADSGNIVVDRTLRARLPAPRLSSKGVEWYYFPGRWEAFGKAVGRSDERSVEEPIKLVLRCRFADRQEAIYLRMWRKDFGFPLHRIDSSRLHTRNTKDNYLTRLKQHYRLRRNDYDSITVRPLISGEKLGSTSEFRFTQDALHFLNMNLAALWILFAVIANYRYGDPMLTWALFTAGLWVVGSAGSAIPVAYLTFVVLLSLGFCFFDSDKRMRSLFLPHSR